METISKIRNWVKSGQKSIRQVSRETGISRVTIRKYLADENSAPHYRRTKPTHSKRLIEHEASLREMIDTDAGRAVRERRSIRGLFEALVLDGYEGSYDTVRRFVLRYKPTSKSASKGYIPLEFDSGDALQFDWSHEVVTLDGVDTKVYAAHFRLCHSRQPFVAVYHRESQEMILDAFNKAFAFYGGVPNRVIIDNPKTMVTFIGKGKERKFHPRFLALMSHYAIEPVACTPASGWEKGQVENQVKYLRGQFFAPKLSFDSLSDLNAHLEERCKLIAKKPHVEAKDRLISDVFSDEQSKLRPVGNAFDGYAERTAKVSGTCLVQYDTNHYSVPCAYSLQSVSLRAYANRIVITDGLDILAEHDRIFERHQKRFELWHYLPLFEQKPGALRDGAPFKHWNMPEALQMIWKHYKKQQGGDRDFIELLTLYQKHGHEAVEMACKLAVEYKTLQLNAIIALLHDLTDEPRVNQVDLKETSHLFLQTPPQADCGRYNQLIKLIGEAA